MPARIQETKIAFGRSPQADIETANVLADLWRFNKLNVGLADVREVVETDAPEIGKGHEFATQGFKVNRDGTFTLEKYLTSELLAWAAAMCLGATVKTLTGPFLYTSTVADGVTDGLERPYFSLIETIRQGASDVLDRMLVGLAVESFLVRLGSGPGRDNSRLDITAAWSGRLTEPSGITVPAATAEHFLPSASLALTIIGVDYVTLKNIVSLEWGFANNFVLDDGFFPGSGVESGFAVRGRIEQGIRAATLRFTARFEDGSTELATLRAQTTGTAVITQTFDANEKYTATFHQVAFESAVIGERNGIVTVEVVCTPQFHTSNGLLTVAATTAIDEIAE